MNGILKGMHWGVTLTKSSIKSSEWLNHSFAIQKVSDPHYTNSSILILKFLFALRIDYLRKENFLASIAFDHIKHHQKLIEPSRLQRENFQLLKIFRRWIGTSRLKMNEWMCQCIFLWWIFCRLLLMNHRNANHVLLCALNWEINAHFYTPLYISQLGWTFGIKMPKIINFGPRISILIHRRRVKINESFLSNAVFSFEQRCHVQSSRLTHEWCQQNLHSSL